MSDKQNTTRQGWFQKGNRKVLVLVTGIAIALVAGIGVQSFASSKAYEHMKLFSSGGHSGKHMGSANWSDADIEAHVERVVKHAAIEIDATQEQQEKVTALVTAVAKDLKPVHDRMRATGMEIRDLLLADTIDRAALEQLRADRLADAEQISKALVGVLADAADVLSSEQRKQLSELIEQFHSKRHGKHSG